MNLQVELQISCNEHTLPGSHLVIHPSALLPAVTVHATDNATHINGKKSFTTFPKHPCLCPCPSHRSCPCHIPCRSHHSHGHSHHHSLPCHSQHHSCHLRSHPCFLPCPKIHPRKTCRSLCPCPILCQIRTCPFPFPCHPFPCPFPCHPFLCPCLCHLSLFPCLCPFLRPYLFLCLCPLVLPCPFPYLFLSPSRPPYLCLCP